MKVQLDITLTELTSAKSHVCDYCNGAIAKNAKYFKATSRKVGEERFPVQIKICKAHDPKLIPLSLFLKRSPS